METFFGLMIVGLVLGGAGLVWWDIRHGMHPGEEPAASPGDVTTIPNDQLARLHRARFERMDGVL